MTQTPEEMRDQMLEWGAERDALRESLHEVEKRLARLEGENGRLRAAMGLIHDRAASALERS
jgi:predicted nuclease with TOPRIM domain